MNLKLPKLKKDWKNFNKMERKKLNKKEENRIILQSIKEVFTEENEGFIEVGDKKKIINEDKPEKPPFPIFIMQVAIFKDIFDSAVFTGVGFIITVLVTFITFMIFFIWILDKATTGGVWKKLMIKSFWKKFVWRAIGLASIEIIPVLSIIPAVSLFVLLVYFEEKKIVILFNKFLEKLHNKGVR